MEREVSIQATPVRVWEVLTAVDRYPDWNPFIPRFEGNLQEGERGTVFLRPPGNRGSRFRPTLLPVREPRELRWMGHLGIPGLFDGEHPFRVDDWGGGIVRFVQSERITGALVPLLRNMTDRSLVGFDSMNSALKARAESPER